MRRRPPAPSSLRLRRLEPPPGGFSNGCAAAGVAKPEAHPLPTPTRYGALPPPAGTQPTAPSRAIRVLGSTTQALGSPTSDHPQRTHARKGDGTVALSAYAFTIYERAHPVRAGAAVNRRTPRRECGRARERLCMCCLLSMYRQLTGSAARPRCGATLPSSESRGGAGAFGSSPRAASWPRAQHGLSASASGFVFAFVRASARVAGWEGAFARCCAARSGPGERRAACGVATNPRA